jgi:hypothetical protein
MNWACMSVGKAGYSLVRKLTAAAGRRRGCGSSLARLDRGAGLAQLVDRRLEVVGAGAAQQHLAARRGDGAEEGAGLDPVGDRAVGDAVQLAHALDPDPARAVALDARAHGDQHLGQVGDLRLLGGVLEHRLALGQGRRHQQVLGAGDGDHVGRDPRTLQPRGAGDDVAVLDRDVGAERLQALDVLVDRPGADGAAARQRHPRLAEAGDQRPEHQDRGAHRLHQVVGRLLARHLLASSETVASASPDCSAATPIWRSSFSIVATSCRRGTFESSTGSAVSSAAQSSAGRRSWRRRWRPRRRGGGRRGCGVCPWRGLRLRAPQAGWLRYSAGVSVFIDSAWICSRMRSPRAL